MAAWGVVAFIALVFVFFARPMYRQGEPSVAGRTAEDFPTDIAGKPGHLSDFPTFREPTRKVALDYGTPVIPDTYIIDRHGKILRKFYGAQQWDSPEMLAYFDAILGKS